MKKVWMVIMCALFFAGSLMMTACPTQPTGESVEEKSAEKQSESTVEPTEEKAEEKATEKTEEKATEKTEEKATEEKTEEKVTEKEQESVQDAGSEEVPEEKKETSADTAPNPDGTVDHETACVNSGGKVETQACCAATSDFPNLCTTGACGCAPHSSKDIKICVCPTGQCYDKAKMSCVAETTP